MHSSGNIDTTLCQPYNSLVSALSAELGACRWAAPGCFFKCNAIALEKSNSQLRSLLVTPNFQRYQSTPPSSIHISARQRSLSSIHNSGTSCPVKCSMGTSHGVPHFQNPKGRKDVTAVTIQPPPNAPQVWMCGERQLFFTSHHITASHIPITHKTPNAILFPRPPISSSKWNISRSVPTLCAAWTS